MEEEVEKNRKDKDDFIEEVGKVKILSAKKNYKNLFDAINPFKEKEKHSELEGDIEDHIDDTIPEEKPEFEKKTTLLKPEEEIKITKIESEPKKEEVKPEVVSVPGLKVLEPKKEVEQESTVKTPEQEDSSEKIAKPVNINIKKEVPSTTKLDLSSLVGDSSEKAKIEEKPKVEEEPVRKEPEKNESSVSSIKTFSTDLDNLKKTQGELGMQKIAAKELEDARRREKELREEAKELTKKSMSIKEDIREKELTEDPKTDEDKQKEIVEKKQTSESWKEFQLQKERFKEKGLMARDLRKMSNERAIQYPKRDPRFIIGVSVTIFLLVAAASILFTNIFLKERAEEVVVEGIENGTETIEQPTVTDIFIPDKTVYIDVTEGFDTWVTTIEAENRIGVITKFTPYEESLSGTSSQIPLQDIFIDLGFRVPRRLISSISGYYLIAKHKGVEDDTYILVISNSSYSDALTGMNAWQQTMVQDLGALFPNTPNVERDIVSGHVFKTETRDNRSIRILDYEGETSLLYYFFNPSNVIIIVGDEELIPEINDRIRSGLSLR